MSFRIITIGTSLGGFDALKTVLGGLPTEFTVPVGIVQHRSPAESDIFAPLLASYVHLPVTEVEDKQEIREGQIYVCPANYHLLVDDTHFALSTDEPVLFARPSIDVFFQSAAESFGESVIGVLLTGMGRDGVSGLSKIKERGGFTVVQDPTTAEAQLMPQAAISSMVVDKILPLEEIPSFLVELCARQGSQV